MMFVFQKMDGTRRELHFKPDKSEQKGKYLVLSHM